ncbi:MAG TPA: hypothetical protein VK890_06920 [Bacteroidia bacterium]|jgi:hypothetical protein|nr:hypothetical protein [Bacteroidia bacterium]
MGNQTWKTISYLFHPVLMPTLGLFIVIISDPYIYLTIDIAQLLPSIGIVFLCTAIFPLLISWVLLKMGGISSLTNPTDNDRKQLIAFSALFFMLGYYVFHNIPPYGKSISHFMLGVNIAMVVTLIANLVTKVSLHAVGVGGILGTVIGLAYYSKLLLMPQVFIAMALVMLVSYARYKLKAHDAADIYIGNIIGIACQAAVFFIASR